MGQVFILLLGAIVLMAGGAYVGYWFGSGGRERGRADQIRKEFDEYRQNVTAHFARTAEHFQTIGKEYRALYEHMASGADSLCDREETNGRLSFEPQAAPAVAEEPAAQEADDTPGTEVDGSGDETPDKRARESGGESAPHEDEDDATRFAESESESDTVTSDAGDGHAGESNGSAGAENIRADEGNGSNDGEGIRVEETVQDAQKEKGDRTYH